MIRCLQGIGSKQSSLTSIQTPTTSTNTPYIQTLPNTLRIMTFVKPKYHNQNYNINTSKSAIFLNKAIHNSGITLFSIKLIKIYKKNANLKQVRNYNLMGYYLRVVLSLFMKWN